ncbi:CRISPR-associated protein Cas1 [Pseudorhodobacter sp. 4114]|nr:CRISPR-associated protein Cas1 [Pseudorhodobacter sp. 4114]
MPAPAEDFVTGHGLRMVSRETRVVGFDRGFQFLGQLFVRSLVLPAPDEPDPNASAVMRELAESDETTAQASTAGYNPSARVLYLVEPDRRLSLRAESSAVLDGGGSLLLSLPAARVNRIELGPGAVVDDPVWRHALATDTTLAFVNGHGETKGVLTSPQTAEAELQLAQAALVLHPERRLALAGVLVSARQRNQRARLSVLNRSGKQAEVDRAITALGRAIRGLAGPMASLDVLRGHEGRAAAIYWPALGSLCAAHKGHFYRERPARSPLNAAINYLTALLARDIRAALIGAGLHPGFGVLHQAQTRGDAAVYDLMEVFRPTLSEGLAVSLFNRRRLREEMFEPQGEGLRILTLGRRALISGYEEALERVIRSSQTGKRHALRRIMLEEARALARHFQNPETVAYLPQVQDY